jgi:hypothetical protein
VGDGAVAEFSVYEFGDGVDGFSYYGFGGVDIGEKGTENA